MGARTMPERIARRVAVAAVLGGSWLVTACSAAPADVASVGGAVEVAGGTGDATSDLAAPGSSDPLADSASSDDETDEAAADPRAAGADLDAPSVAASGEGASGPGADAPGDLDGGGPGDGPEPLPMPGEPVAPGELAPGALVQLTRGGCCTQPTWRADGTALWFIDRPEGGETGIYEVSLAASGAEPVLATTDIAPLSPDQRWRIERAPGRTTLVRLADGQAFDVGAGGRSVAFAPDGERIAWQTDIQGAPPERNVATVWVGTPDGAERQEVARLTRGSLSGWLDDQTLLARGREAAQAEEDILWAYPLGGGERREIARARRMRGQLLSPGGRWLIWYVAGDPEPAANGLWLADTAPGGPPPRRLEGRFGAYQWRDARRLVMVPFDVGAPSHRLIELDVETGTERPLTNPQVTPLRIANGDWSVSPDGRHVAFVSAADANVWVLRLPE